MNATEYNEMIQDKSDSTTTFYVGIASYTVLIWDHLLTFGDEVHCIWKTKKSPLIWLFFLNRYLTPLAFILNLFAYFSNVWTPEMCEHFVRYEGATTVVGINTSALMMLFRIYAMYPKKSVVIFVATIFAIELGTNAWLVTNGVAVKYSSPAIHACTMVFSSDKVTRAVASASAWLPLLYDTTVFVLTVWRTYYGIRAPTVARTMKILFKEGVMYYSVIFSITLALTLTISLAPPGLQNIAAQMEYLMTVAMMSRITLHLKKEAYSTHDPFDSHTTYDPTSSMGGWRFSPIEFAHKDSTHMTISIQGENVTRKDRGEQIQTPKKAYTHAEDSWAAQEERFEFAPLEVDVVRDDRGIV